MAKVSFHLQNDKINSKGIAPIRLQFTHLGKKVRLSTGEGISPKSWNEETQRVKTKSKEALEINGVLDSLEADLMKMFREAKAIGINLTAESLKAQYLKKNKPSTNDFFSLFEVFLSSSESTKTKGTLANYKNSLQYLKRFNKEKDFLFEFENIDNSFYEKFITYLLKDIKLSNNTVGRVVKILKTFLNWTTDLGFNKNLSYKKFKIFREDIEIVYLKKIELDLLQNLVITSSSLSKVRDLFLLGCFTGLRFSDLTRIRTENIQNDEIVLRTIKTKDFLRIPLIPQAKVILEKNNNCLPSISHQKMNDRLKELCEKAGINEITTITRYRGAIRIDEKLPKYSLITTHTARRTFVTLSLELGMRPEIVMKVTGHKDYRTMKSYIKIVDQVKRDEMLNAWKF